MPTPTRPSTYPAWTQGNPPARVEPSGSQKLAGFYAGERPPAEWHNFLFGISSDWIEWLDYITQSFPASNVSADNSGHIVATGTTVQAQLDEIDSFLAQLGIHHEAPAKVTADTWQLVNTPEALDNLIVMMDGAVQDNNWIQLTTYGGNPAFQFKAGHVPAPGQDADILAIIFTGGATGGAGLVNGAANLGTSPDGYGVFSVLTAGILKFFRIKAGAGINITQETNNLLISNAGATGGYTVTGSEATPEVITAGGGIGVTTDQRQLIFVKGAGGAMPITANPQIAAGSVVGQELLLSGAHDTDYIELQDGFGLSLNGAIRLINNETLPLFWTGTVWKEISRR